MFVEAEGAGKYSRARAEEGHCVKMEAYLCFVCHLPVQSHTAIHQHQYRYRLISKSGGLVEHRDAWIPAGTM